MADQKFFIAYEEGGSIGADYLQPKIYPDASAAFDDSRRLSDRFREMNGPRARTTFAVYGVDADKAPGILDASKKMGGSSIPLRHAKPERIKPPKT